MSNDQEISCTFGLTWILSIVDTLSEEKQKIIKMRFWEDLKFSEIAENLNKSEDAVKKMFYRTIEELKNKFWFCHFKNKTYTILTTIKIFKWKILIK